jgi:multidrug efflux pump subunit AcrB
MKITSFSVKNYQFTIVIFIMALALGLGSLFKMPRGEDPPLKVGKFSIVVVYPGTSPGDMEKLVTKPIEDRINELDDIKTIKSDIDDGLSVTLVEFTYGSKIDDKYNEVVREVNGIRSQLPGDILAVDIQKSDASDVNTYQLAITSETASYKQLYDQADLLKSSLEKIREIKKVKIHGYPQQQIRIAVDLSKMAQKGISLNQVVTALQGSSVNIPGGSIDAGEKKFNIKTSGDYASVGQIQNTVVASHGAQILFLKDIAEVAHSYADATYLARFNGKRGVFISISEKDKTNIIEVNQKIEPLLAKFSKEIPGNMKLHQGFVQAEDVSMRLEHFTRDFIIAILLVLITLIPLGGRASLIVMISIPLSIAIGLFLLDILGYTINQLSIVGLIVALGLLVDDSIVVIENIERYLRNGYSPKQAAIEATQQIGVAIIGCTAILIVAFLPVLFMPEMAGEFIRSLPMAVVTTVLASLFVSLTVVPFLASLILKKHAHAGGNVVLRKMQQVINRSYKPVLHKALARPFVTLGVALLLFIGVMSLIPAVGFSLFPTSEKPMFMIDIETPLGTAFSKTDAVTRYVEQELRKDKDIKAVFANVGKGNPMIYYNIIPKNESANFAQVFIRLKPMKIKEISELVARYRTKFEGYPNAKIQVKQFEQGPIIEAPVAIRIFGENLDSLRSVSASVAKLIGKVEGTIYTNNQLETYKTDVRINVNRDKAAIYGISSNEIDRVIRMGVSGVSIAGYKDEKGDNLPIVVTLPRSKPQTMAVFDDLYINTPAGAAIPLNQLATLDYKTSVPTIRHYNKSRYATVTSYVKPGYNTQKITQKVMEDLKKLSLPHGFSYVAAGEFESSQESFGNLGAIILVTLFGFMGILLLEFKTFKGSLIVLSVIPLGMVGAVSALFITGNTLSFVAVIGIIALAGIEVKNSILLVDYTNQLREEGMGIDEAIEIAGETRFLPIILTSLTAIGGLIPLVMESSPFYSPLAWVLIGGLISSTILTRLITPVMYKLLAPKVQIKVAEPD